MRSSVRLLAKVQPTRFLEANTPTGLTGLSVHPSPRPALIYTYKKTLEKLKALPESSVYRQSTEALTKHRLKIVEDTKPAGYDDYLTRVQKAIAASPDAYGHLKDADGALAYEDANEEKNVNWDGISRAPHSEGMNTQAMVDSKVKAIQEEDEERKVQDEGRPTVEDLEVEPPWSVDQIDEVETKIAAGLIEEVITVADGELTLVDEMKDSAVWEPLDESPAPGQWEYFERH